MLMPKRVKHRKQHRGRRTGAQQPGGATTVHFGQYGLQALETCWMTSNQIESARIAMTRKIRRGGKIWIRVFPDKPITKKPAETRMGKGKGAPEGWVAVVKPGCVLFEMSGVNQELAREAMRLAAHKLPIKTRFIMRQAGDVSAPGSARLVDEAGMMIPNFEGEDVESLMREQEAHQTLDLPETNETSAQGTETASASSAKDGAGNSSD